MYPFNIYVDKNMNIPNKVVTLLQCKYRNGQTFRTHKYKKNDSQTTHNDLFQFIRENVIPKQSIKRFTFVFRLTKYSRSEDGLLCPIYSVLLVTFPQAQKRFPLGRAVLIL